jgi:hypothetical protein
MEGVVADVSATDPTKKWPLTSTEGIATRLRSIRPGPQGCDRQCPRRQWGETVPPPVPFAGAWASPRSCWYSVTSWAEAYRTGAVWTLPRAASSGVMPSVSRADRARFAFSHVSSSVQAGSSFKSRVRTWWLVRCIVTSTETAPARAAR